MLWKVFLNIYIYMVNMSDIYIYMWEIYGKLYIF